MRTELKKADYDKLPGALQEFCTEDGDNWIFEAESSDSVKGLKSALRKEKEEVKRLKTASEGDPYDGLDADEVKDAIEKIKKGELGKAANQSEIDKLVARAKKEGAKEAQTAADAEIAKRDAELAKHKLTAPVKDAIIKSGVIPTLADDVLRLTADRFRLTDTGKIEVLDGDGDPTGKTVEDFFSKDYKNERPHFFAASGAGGSGAPPNNGNGGAGKATITRAQWDQMSHADRGAIDFKTTSIVD